MGESTSGKVTITGTSFPVGDVDVFVVGHEWEPVTTTNAMGEFILTDLCATGLRLKFQKSGYFTEQEQYGATTPGSFIAVPMTEMSKYNTCVHEELPRYDMYREQDDASTSGSESSV